MKIKKIPLFFYFFPLVLFAKWNNNYSFFGGDNEDAVNSGLHIFSYVLMAFGVFLFFHSLYKLLGSNSPEDKTRGALLMNVFLLIVSILLIGNVFFIKKILGVD